MTQKEFEEKYGLKFKDTVDEVLFFSVLDDLYLKFPKEQVIDMICATCDLHPVIFMTGREDRHTCRHDTIVQLKEFSNGKINMQDPECPHKLLMRDEFDYRPGPVVKEEKLLQVIRAGYMPLVAIDDEIENCQMFMKYGLKTIRYDIEAQLLKRCEYDTSGCDTTERAE